MNQSYCDCRGGISTQLPLLPFHTLPLRNPTKAQLPPAPGAAQAHAYRIFKSWSPDLPVIPPLQSRESPRSALVCFVLIIKSGFINAV